MTCKTNAAAGTVDRKAELERQMLKLQGEIEDTTAAPAKLKLIIKLKKAEDEYNTYYHDEKRDGYGF